MKKKKGSGFADNQLKTDRLSKTAWFSHSTILHPCNKEQRAAVEQRNLLDT